MISTNAIGVKLIKSKKINFLSLKLILILNFFIKIKHNAINGIKIPICFKVNKIGFIR